MRTLAWLAVLLAGAGAGSCGSGKGDTGVGSGPRQATPPRDPSLPQQVGQTLILRFEGPIARPYVLRALREGRVAGVILFSDNVVSSEQLRSLTRSLQRAAGGGALVMTDQEGGAVRIVSFAGPELGQASRAGRDETRRQAAAAGRDLRRLGINVNLAPVADVPSVAGAALGGRAFGGDAATVAARVEAAIQSYAAARVAATVKHFPGLGAARENTDDAPVTLPGPSPEDLEPFRAAIAADVPLVMASHALYPSLDRGRIASQSPAVLGGLLRHRLGFRGVVVTDSMEADAVLRRSSVAVAGARALEAGADLLLLTGSGSFRLVSQHLLARARRSPALRARLREANARVVALKARLGLRASPPRG